MGATGMVGQQFVALLAHHPWFSLRWLAASERSAGQRYADLPWSLSAPLPEDAGRLVVEDIKPGKGPRVVFSALDASVAGEVEEAFATAGHIVVSNARNHRMDPQVPLLVPEINPDHLGLLWAQRQLRNWRGAIVTNPNCSTTFIALALAALRSFQPERVIVTTLQALSGAGRPGLPALDALANVIPFIEGEEEKIQTETQKILGCLRASTVKPHPLVLSAQATRVPVLNGHTALVSIALREKVSCKEVRAAFQEFSGRPQALELPSAPVHPLVYTEVPDRPQPRLDTERFGGMAVHVGRLRPCSVFDYRFVLLGHNTIRGAAGAAVLSAELMVVEQLLD